MEIKIIDTDEMYRELLALENQKRALFFDKNILEPFAEIFRIIGMPRNPDILGCLPLVDNDDAMNQMLDQLTAIKAWTGAKEALLEVTGQFDNEDLELPNQVVVGILLGNPEFLALSKGYTGMGSVPGYILVVIAPNDYNMPRLNADIIHEFHHNVLFNNIKWSFMDVTVSQYLAIEGLAESYAKEVYGADFIGPWVTDVSPYDLDSGAAIIGKHLDASGFMEARKYIFGDHPMLSDNEKTGIAYCGGYAAGYYAVQRYLDKTDSSVIEATIDFVNDIDIVRESGYFV